MRYLSQINFPATPPSSPALPPSEKTDNDLAIILAAIFCGVICVLFILITLARWVWIYKDPGTPKTKKQKKKILKTLPKLGYSETVGEFSDCAICLMEFIAGDELRVLPQCGHGFHVRCIETWLVSHLSCPSCRHVVSKLEKCNGELTEEISAVRMLFLH